MGHIKIRRASNPEGSTTRETGRSSSFKRARAMGPWHLLATLLVSPERCICGISGSAGRSMIWKVKRGAVISRRRGKSIPSPLCPSQHMSGRRTRRSDPSLQSSEIGVSDIQECKESITTTGETSSLPKLAGPRGGTILPGVRPWNNIGSWPGPAEKANVQTAEADLSSYAARRLFSPVRPRASRNHLLRAGRS
jgi:hypothetical protein